MLNDRTEYLKLQRLLIVSLLVTGLGSRLGHQNKITSCLLVICAYLSASKSNKTFYESVRTPQDLIMICYTGIYLSAVVER